MKYFLDTEFLEGTQKTWFGKTKPTIDLISIGIVAEDSREYYAISKDFNLKEAWNRWQQRTMEGDRNNLQPRLYWIRENVLEPIYKDLLKIQNDSNIKGNYMFGFNLPVIEYNFTYKNLKKLINKYGKTNKQIAEEVKEFCSKHLLCNRLKDKNEKTINQVEADSTPKEFYGYYSDYDWVVFCWLFGKMIDLPKEFPMYCIDLKQEMDNKIKSLNWLYGRDCWSNNNRSVTTISKGEQQEKDRLATFDEKINTLKELKEYPKQTHEHNALADAKWNFELYNFLKSL